MAKRIGEVDENTGRVKAGKVRGKQVEWPVTYVTTRGQRIKRALVG